MTAISYVSVSHASRPWQRMTTCEKFRVGCSQTSIGVSRNLRDSRRRSLIFGFVLHHKAPFVGQMNDLSLLVIRAWKPLSTTNGENLAIGSSSTPDSIKRKCDQFTDCTLILASKYESKIYSVLFYVCLGSIVRLNITSFYPLPTYQEDQHGYVNFL